MKNWNYNSNAVYHITICVQDRHEMLGKVVGRDAPGAPSSTENTTNTPSIELSEYGKIVFDEIEETKSHYPDITVDNFIVMPNHIHILIRINREDGAPRASRPTTALIPRIITVLKRKTNKAYGFNMWQDSYHDHIIRDEAEYQRIWQYVESNPERWEQDEYNNKII